VFKRALFSIINLAVTKSAVRSSSYYTYVELTDGQNELRDGFIVLDRAVGCVRLFGELLFDLSYRL